MAELQGLESEMIKLEDDDNNDNCPFPFIVKRPAANKRASAKGAKQNQFKKK